MNSQRPSVSLKKPEPWTDPVTGEIYPGGDPNRVKTAEPQSVPVMEVYTPSALPRPVNGNIQSMHCTHCGTGMNAGAKFCPSCGAPNQAANADNIKYCTSCRAQIPYKAMFCSSCGAPADAANGEIKYCSFCGAQIPLHSRFCSKCGKEAVQTYGQPAQQPQNQPIIINNNIVQNAPAIIQAGKAKNKWLSFVLCLLFGIFGVHRFYEGKIGTGILWLLTWGCFGIGWLVDLIIILTKPDPYYV